MRTPSDPLQALGIAAELGSPLADPAVGVAGKAGYKKIVKQIKGGPARLHIRMGCVQNSTS